MENLKSEKKGLNSRQIVALVALIIGVASIVIYSLITGTSYLGSVVPGNVLANICAYLFFAFAVIHLITMVFNVRHKTPAAIAVISWLYVSFSIIISPHSTVIAPNQPIALWLSAIVYLGWLVVCLKDLFFLLANV